MRFLWFHSVGYKNHSVKYISHTVKQRIFSVRLKEFTLEFLIIVIEEDNFKQTNNLR